MAGTTDSFDAAAFRDAIHFAMEMGTPTNPTEQAKFRWITQKTYAKADSANRPFSWTASPTSTTSHADVTVPVSVKIERQTQELATPVGAFEPQRIKLTLLDEDYAQVVGADQVVINDITYAIQYVAPPTGLFEVTVYTIFAEAVDVG